LPDCITQGQFRRFLKKNHFTPKGKKKNRYVGILGGNSRIITFHYHKDNDIIPSGTLSALARQLDMTKQELVDKVKTR
jgi:hypothetical protein